MGGMIGQFAELEKPKVNVIICYASVIWLSPADVESSASYYGTVGGECLSV